MRNIFPYLYLDTQAHFNDDESVWNKGTLTQSVGALTHNRNRKEWFKAVS